MNSNQQNDSSSSSGDQCQPNNHLIFMKTHKTGGTTLQMIIHIYGYYRNLSFVIHATEGSGHIGYHEIDVVNLLPPISVSTNDYQNYKDYNIFASHLKYNRTALDFIMKKNSRYISILRDPVTQFESAFVFFGYYENMNGTTTELKIDQWLDDPEHYRHLGDPRAWLYVNNNQIYDLGLSDEDFKDEAKVSKYIAKLSHEFDLVLLMEYFDESLLLLRKLMCWSFADIVYLKQNARSGGASHLSQRVKDKIREWNSADVSLYRHFNQTFWKKIHDYGPHFQQDLQYFRQKQTDLRKACVKHTKLQTVKDRKISRVRYSLSSNASDYCMLMAEREIIFRRLKKRQSGQVRSL